MIISKKITALLPMKANSERVKGKNFKMFCGKPLYRWTLDKLLSLDFIQNVVINTDAFDILQKNNLPENDKIIIHERPKSLCGDFVSMNSILEYDLKNSNENLFLMTHTTNPLISKNTFSNSITTFLNNTNTHDSLFSANEVKTRFYDSDSNPINHDPKNLIRTQDLQPFYEENSCIYIFSKESFQLTKNRIGLNPKIFLTPRIESIDIDDQFDWDIAEVIQKTKSFFS